MWTVLIVLSLLAAFALPIQIVGWLRKRRREAIRRQVALTEALDWELGPMVAPEVRKPLWGPWQIRIAVPLQQAGTVGKILYIAHSVLSVAERMTGGHYQIVLTRQEEAAHGL